MSTEIATRATTALTIAEGQREFTPQQISALEHAGVSGAPKADLDVFFHQCVRRGLDPFLRQIHMIGRNTQNQRTHQWEMKYTIQTGIDGYRLIARRAADAHHETYGYEDTIWYSEDGQERPFWLKSWGNPAAARVVVVKSDGTKYPAVAVWDEYVQTTREGKPNSIWSRMGANQLAKCAEALALRKAYPEDLSGIYTDEEMQQADSEAVHQVQPRQQHPQSAARALQQEEPAWKSVDWRAEVEAAGDDYDALGAIYQRAQEMNGPSDLLAFIYARGEEILAAQATTPDPGDVQPEEAR